jgi:cytochrome d ubiquinol oxidase subunit II
MTLADVWFVLFVIVIAGYLILDGFDIGVGILHLPMAKTDRERRLVLNSIGPVWDGNEVWIVLGGGVLFGAFPLVYASLFSGFYLPFVLVLLVLILRTAAVEFRSKRVGPRWRRTWDWTFAATSVGLALLLGIAFGNILAGLKINSNGDIEDSLLDLFTWYPLLIGVTSVALFALHGALFLALKTEGDVHDRVREAIPRLATAFFVLATSSVLATALFQNDVEDQYFSDLWLVIFPAGALVAFAYAAYETRRRRDFWAFVASGAMIALLLSAGAAGLYPNLLPSTIDDKYSLGVNNAASASNTLTVMLIMAAIGIPMILLYTAGIYYFFRGKTELGPDSY